MVMQVTAQHYQLPIIYVQMDSELIPEEMTAIPKKPRVVPFYPVKTPLPKSAGGYYRSQLPLTPFHARSTVNGC